MTLPASGPLVLGLTGGGNSINGEFGLGNNLQSYLGAYYGKNGQEFQFPVPGNSIDMDIFHGAKAITPQDPYYLTPGQPFTVPLYNQLTVRVQGGQGGTSGQPGYYADSGCGNGSTPGSSGSQGQSSAFGGYIVGASGGAGGAGSALVQNGGTPGAIVEVTFTNPTQGGNGPPSGQIFTPVIGVGGGGGQGGCIVYKLYNICGCYAHANTGNNGSDGSILVSWK